VEDLRAHLGLSHDSIVYVGDGSSDVNVMLHVNRFDGLTISVSEKNFCRSNRQANGFERRRFRRPGPDSAGHLGLEFHANPLLL